MASGNKSNKANNKNFQKSYFDVLGICCTSEVPLIEKILRPLDGVHEVSVIVPSRTVIVIHDNLLISQTQIVKALNQARLEANIRAYGEEKHEKRWPSPYTIVCGLLLAVSFFKYFFHPLKWVALGAVAVGLPPIIFRSIAAIRNFTLDINILLLIAVGGSIALGDYWEAGTIVFLFTIAEWLQSRASQKANAVMSSLISMTPQKAVLAETGHVVNAKDVNINTILAVKAGEVIPIDGVVVEGSCEVDEKALTGEPFPVAKQDQSNVWAGTINLNGYISMQTTVLSEDCMLSQMAKLVEEAQNSKSRTQTIIDECAKYYTPVVVLISIGLVAVPTVLRSHNLKHWVYLALVVLVSACPCALILSTPVATFCALTKAATTGLLIKGGEYLEILAKIKTVAFDKTGTITRGEFSVTNFQSINPEISENTLLYWVSSIESKSSHPMAAALVDYGRLNSIEPQPENVKDFQNFPGEGIYGVIEGKQIFVGNMKIATRAGCKAVPPQEDGTKGATKGYILFGASLVGKFSLADTCRSGVAEAIKDLKSLGIKTAILTGDSQAAATWVQDQLGRAINIVHAELLPEDKVRIIKDLKEERPTAMVGDGVNDAPALATADIGISMGVSGSALANETGHVTLMSNDIRKIPQAIQLARKTRWKIMENVGLSVVTKAAIVALAFSGHPVLWAAVLADVGTCLLVILNSMLILRGSHKHGKKCQRLAHSVHEHDCHDCHDKSHSHRPKHCEHKKGDCHDKSHSYRPKHCEHKKDDCHDKSHSHRPKHCEHKKDDCHDKSHAENGERGSAAPSHASHVVQIESEEGTCMNHTNRDGCLTCTRHDFVNGPGAVSCRLKEDNHVHSISTTCEAKDHHNHGLVQSTKVDSKSISSCCQNEHGRECKKQVSTLTIADSKDLSMMHVCSSLEKREVGACCRSYRMECKGTQGYLCGGIGTLSEIVTE
ncbi:hypothetical protein Syun_024772 [Stephania yunnanensis]|uniref:HMA domain-containing protein n=1 Tax=Stephania yunnanensis TaxID=152371 RepID=A0AAP0EVR1_9MAGN